MDNVNPELNEVEVTEVAEETPAPVVDDAPITDELPTVTTEDGTV